MTIHIAICDTDIEYPKHLQNLILNYGEPDHTYEISLYHNDVLFIDKYCECPTCNVILVNMELEHMSGIDLVKIIRQSIDDSVIPVFYGDYPEYMYDPISMHPYYFFQKTNNISVILNILHELTSEYFHYFKNSNNRYVKDLDRYINDDDILYIEHSDKPQTATIIHTISDIITISGNTFPVDSFLKSPLFARCDDRIIVNLTHITSFNDSSIILDNANVLTVSKDTSRDIRHLYLQYAFSLKKRQNAI